MVLAEGAYSAAWRRDGALAHFVALEPDIPNEDAIRRYVGHVVVRRAPRSPPRRWTSVASRYIVAAWAGERLLVYRIGGQWPELLALAAPGRLRVLARDAALLAVSPDGRRVLVSTFGASPPLVRLLDVGSGRELAGLRFRPPVRWLAEAGSWEGERAVVKGSPGLVAFRLNETIELERVVRIPAGVFPLGLFEPVSDTGGERIVAWGELPRRPRQAFADVALVDCDLERLRCVRGERLSGGVGVRLVYDPSRPSS